MQNIVKVLADTLLVDLFQKDSQGEPMVLAEDQVQREGVRGG